MTPDRLENWEDGCPGKENEYVIARRNPEVAKSVEKNDNSVKGPCAVSLSGGGATARGEKGGGRIYDQGRGQTVEFG